MRRTLSLLTVLLLALQCNCNRGIKDICVSFDEIESGQFFTDDGLKIDVIEENFSANITVEISDKKMQKRAFMQQILNARLNAEAIIVCDNNDKMSIGSRSSSQSMTNMLTSGSRCTANVNFTMAIYLEKVNEMKRLRVHCPKGFPLVEHPCVDRFSKCSRWKLSYCWGNFNEWMRRNCPESCKFCQAETAGTCSDDQQYRRSCILWKEQNLCAGGKWSVFVKRKCPASCNLCN